MAKKVKTRGEVRRANQVRKEQQKINKKNEDFLKQRIFRKDLIPLIQQINSLSSGLLSYGAVLNAVTHYFNIDETRKKEFDRCLKWVEKRRNIAKEINEGGEDYKNRIKLCEKYEINIYDTILPQQINADVKLSKKQKEKLLGIKEVKNDKENST